MRLLTCAMALIFSSNAVAGGVGLIATGGAHGDHVYFYDGSVTPPAQYRIGQTIVSAGGGLELLLGNQDDRFTGTFKGYFVADSPESDPAERTQAVNPSDVVSNVREEWRHIGIATVGFQARLISNDGMNERRMEAEKSPLPPMNLVASVDIGSGFLTNNHTEFFTGSVGVGGTIDLPMEMQVFGLLQYNTRYRKYFRHGGQATVGVRYMFD